MKAKICFNNETHRLSKLPETFDGLSKLVNTIFLSDLPEHWRLEYLDAEGDQIMLADNQDYTEFINSTVLDKSSTSTTKIFIVPQEAARPSVVQYVEKNFDASQDLKELSQLTENTESLVQQQDTQKEDHALKVSEESSQEPAEKDTSTNDQASIEKIISEAISSITEKISKASDLVAESQQEQMKPKIEEPVVPSKVEAVKQVCTQAIKKIAPKVVNKPAGKPTIQKNMIKATVNKKVLDELINKAVEKNIAKIAMMTEDYISKKNSSSQIAEIIPPQVQKQEEQVTHRHVRCDGCSNYPLIGVRYKCSVCLDFDFCELCEQSKDHEHAFIKIKTPNQAFSHAGLSSIPYGRSRCPYFNRNVETLPQIDEAREVPVPSKEEPVVKDEPTIVKEEHEADKEEEKNSIFKNFIVDDSMIYQDSEPEDVKKEESKEKNSIFKNVIVDDSMIYQDSETEDVKKEETKEKTYSKSLYQKALVLKEIFPNQDLEALLAFVANAPEDLDLNELAENFRF